MNIGIVQYALKPSETGKIKAEWIDKTMSLGRVPIILTLTADYQGFGIEIKKEAKKYPTKIGASPRNMIRFNDCGTTYISKIIESFV